MPGSVVVSSAVSRWRSFGRTRFALPRSCRGALVPLLGANQELVEVVK